MRDRLKGRETRNYTFGALLIVLGLLMLGDQFRIGYDPFGIRLDLGRLWPVVLLVTGAGRFISARAAGLSGGGYWMMFLGAMFLLHTFEVLRMQDSWPLFIVAGGLSLILGGDRPSRGECKR